MFPGVEIGLSGAAVTVLVEMLQGVPRAVQQQRVTGLDLGARTSQVRAAPLHRQDQQPARPGHWLISVRSPDATRMSFAARGRPRWLTLPGAWAP
ncbi:MAG: hypothetical protein L0H79_13955 [Intrasporangium sp.]|uniref:hypothetical protein n=1 Tax=Intrasporangium sp. TaxID=1925024 RepID=UPI002648DFF7|nr:hypothetical protein [Intrasporangium sp.]MDN5796844.1 hypothetical protein [Intrasporangium sp.]